MRGHITQRSNGSYTIVLDTGPDPRTGKRKQKWLTVRGGKRDAERELNRLLNQINTGSYIEPVKLTVTEYLDRWLKDYAETHVSGKTLDRYRGIIDRHFKPAFGQTSLQRLQPLHIQAHYSNCLKAGGRKDGREGGLSPQTVLHHHRLIHEALKLAVRWQLLARNPADAVEPPNVREHEVHAIDESTAVALLDSASGTRVRVPVLLAITCGLRRGEILAVRWSDLDWFANTLTIARSLEETKAGIRFKEPKTPRGYRSIALPPFALEILKEHRNAQEEFKSALGIEYQDHGLICCVENGAIWKPSAFTSAYRDLLRRRKLSGPKFHALRHSHASHLLRAGVDVKLISQRLGHSRTAFTLDTYAHILPGQDAEAARRVENAYQKVRNADPDASVSKALANDFPRGRKQAAFVS